MRRGALGPTSSESARCALADGPIGTHSDKASQSATSDRLHQRTVAEGRLLAVQPGRAIIQAHGPLIRGVPASMIPRRTREPARRVKSWPVSRRSRSANERLSVCAQPSMVKAMTMASQSRMSGGREGIAPAGRTTAGETLAGLGGDGKTGCDLVGLLGEAVRAEVLQQHRKPTGGSARR